MSEFRKCAKCGQTARLGQELCGRCEDKQSRENHRVECIEGCSSLEELKELLCEWIRDGVI